MKVQRDRGARERALRLLAGMSLLLGAALSPAAGIARAAHVADAAGPFTGWAMDAYPGDSVSTLKAEMARQQAAGANIVWLGHNNPGEVDIHKGEPGLSYAVWAAYRDPGAARHGDAVAIMQAQLNAIEAARELGMRVVLPVGYQIQMGQAWNTAHPQDLRRGADGGIYEHGGKSASFYAPDYQHDILAYYRWVDATIVRPNAGAIVMLNLGDEPADGDYSVWADGAFRARYGYGLREAGNDPIRQEAVGRFQAEYVADYEAWSAAQWQALDPGVKVTMSFDGGYGRYMHEGPDLEAVFRKAPSNFVVTFDAYPRDGLYNTALRESDLIALFALVRTLGYYAARYDRPLWLWSTANSWGLNGASSDPGNIADAVANAIYLAQLSVQGGSLQGIAVWNYNIKGQGLFNDTHTLTYDPNQMFARVSASFPLLRAIMSAPAGQPDTVVLAPNAPVFRAAGATLALRATDGYHWTALAALARNNVAAPVLTHLDGANLPALHAAIVLARTPNDLSSADRGALLTLLGRGGTIVAATAVAQALLGAHTSSRVVAASGNTSPLAVRQIGTPQGLLLGVAGGDVERIFADSADSWAAGLWRQVLRCTVQNSGYLVAAGGTTLLYSALAPQGATMALARGGQGTLTVFNTFGVAQQAIQTAGSGALEVFVPRRSYALLPPAGL